MNWIDLVSSDQLEEIREQSHQTPVLIFKHSTTCAISAMAFHRLQRKAINIPVYFLDLRAYRNISNLIETTFDVEHESPQVLIIENGKAVYRRSHYEIDPKGIQDFLRSPT